MNSPIDPDLDDNPRIDGWSRKLLESNFRSASEQFAEERTENRRLRKALAEIATLDDTIVTSEWDYETRLKSAILLAENALPESS